MFCSCVCSGIGVLPAAEADSACDLMRYAVRRPSMAARPWEYLMHGDAHRATELAQVHMPRYSSQVGSGVFSFL